MSLPESDQPTFAQFRPVLADYIRGLLPSIEELTAITDAADMGPEVTLPAIYVHMLLLDLELARAEAKNAAIMPKAVASLVERFRTCEPGATLSEDDCGNFAGDLATVALIGIGGDPTAAILVLMQAAGSLALSQVAPTGDPLITMKGAAEVTIERLSEVLGKGASRQ